MLANPPFTADQTEFLSALGEWSGRTEFPLSAPPCGGCGSEDEDAILAQIFAEVASAPTDYATSRMALLTAAITVHQAKLDAAWDAARSSKPGTVADRSTWARLRPYQGMIYVLHSWLGALWAQQIGGAA